MIIRPGEENDIPAIVDLLRISLGETLIPKSENLWKWKHEANPFGKSPVILAEENGVLVGVRAFLRWEFVEDGKIIKALRAVDTATHPEYQGKGIFSKLTLALLDEMKKDGTELVFNTPNGSSAPGYLKMGWEKWGKLPLKLNFHFGKSVRINPENSDWALVDDIVQNIETSKRPGGGIQTKLVPGYLHWRYRDNPLFPYQFVSDGKSYLLVYRIKESKMGREFRICDLFTTRQLSKTETKELKDCLNHRIRASGARFSSFSGLSCPTQNLINLGVLPILKIGPLVTLRKMQENFNPMDQSWTWSLGDLEVF